MKILSLYCCLGAVAMTLTAYAQTHPVQAAAPRHLFHPDHPLTGAGE